MTHVNLARSLRLLFGAARIFCLIAIPVTLLGLLLPPRWGIPSNVHTSAAVSFWPNGFSVQQDIHPAAAELRLASLTGAVGINEKLAGSEAMAALNRETLLPSLLLTYLIAAVVCDILWRLCGNVERGSVFTETNLKLVRWLGILLALGTPLSAFVQHWTDYRLNVFALQHLSFGGLTPLPAEFHGFETLLLTFLNHLSALITGLLILVLAEVFRQGLALKQEADLTV